MGAAFPVMRRLAVIPWVALLLGAVCFRMGAAVTPPPDADQHWAFQALRAATPPAVSNVGWCRNELDRFVLRRMEAEGIAPPAPADARAFLRRLCLDLVGLPPTFDEVRAFETHWARDPDAAVALAADRLLADPRHGERWGRHWLDLARYSDTKGYVYAREESKFVQAVAYRDWVVNAINRDLPYDRFIQLQVAADQLVPPGSPDLAAMGFLTLGRRFLGVTHDIIDDRIDVVCRTTLGLTVSCARCHDHKYDPIPTADYYSLYGVFAASADVAVPLQPSDDAELAKRRKAYADAHAKRRAEAEARLATRVEDYLRAQLSLKDYPEEGFDQILTDADIIPHSVRRWRDWLARPGPVQARVFGPWLAVAALEAADGDGFETAARAAIAARASGATVNPMIEAALKPPLRGKGDVAAAYGKVFREAHERRNATNAPPALAELVAFLRDPLAPARIPDGDLVNIEYYVPTPVTEELGKLQGDIDRRLFDMGLPVAVASVDKPDITLPRVFRRGSPSQPGAEVPRQFLRVLSRGNRAPFTQGSGRLELARAITDPSNALALRTIVNRVWQHHFGTGLVPTSSDLGLRAGLPSHPELLEWLAGRFLAEGRSLKALHRLIVCSAAYRATGMGGHPSDPARRLLSAFPRQRLSFEMLRDSMLAASGELDGRMGGTTQPLLDAQSRRRTLYAFVDRQFLPGVLRTFDFANPDLHVSVRHETTVPQQGLFFLNGPFAAQRARALASRTRALPPATRVAALHQALFQREPTAAETSAALRFIQSAEAGEPPEPEPWKPGAWSQGTGEVDVASGSVRGYKPLPRFTGAAWQGAEAWPGGDTGWARLTADGGHPGNTRAHAVVRRWTAPADLRVTIEGTLRHEVAEGDGVRGFVLAPRVGMVASNAVHKASVVMKAGPLDVRAGESIDFVVDIRDGLNSDQFLWAPVVVAGERRWDAAQEFSGPPTTDERLRPWEQYAQVLLLSNEMAFAD
ncbi:MAG: hypothetical protein RL153_2267 [Verrucomicrobiota bacterium]